MGWLFEEARLPKLFYFLLMLFVGVGVALQPLVNANLAARVGVAQSSFISFAVGTAAMAAVMLAYGHGSLAALPGTPLWQLTGGLLGALFVTAIIIAAPKIGTLAALSAAIATQLITGAALDHFGLLGGRTIPLDPWRVAGALMLFAGAGLMMKGV